MPEELLALEDLGLDEPEADPLDSGEAVVDDQISLLLLKILHNFFTPSFSLFGLKIHCIEEVDPLAQILEVHRLAEREVREQRLQHPVHLQYRLLAKVLYLGAPVRIFD